MAFARRRTMANFDRIIPMIIAAEGGAKVTEDPADPGGLTKYGISQSAYPSVDIRGLTEERAKELYKRDYWDKVNGDLIPDDRLAYFVLDMAVNMGVGVACHELQAAINRLSESGKKIAKDGRIGGETLRALNLILPGGPAAVLRSMLRARIERYARQVQASPPKSRFLVGC